MVGQEPAEEQVFDDGKPPKINKVTLTFVILFTITIVFLSIRRSYLISHYEKYTIGTTVEIFYSVPVHKNVTYEYRVNNRNYRPNCLYNSDYGAKVPGGRYYVKFSGKKLWISDLLQDKPVPDSIKQAPSKGWDKIPSNE